MDDSSTKKLSAQVGERIKKIRKARGLTQAALADNHFTKGYISALERGAVRPSFKALEVLARLLEVPVEEFLSPSANAGKGPNIEALKEELLFQADHVKLLIRAGQVQEALQMLASMERQAQPHNGALPPEILYVVPFLRGKAFLQSAAPDLARAELELALRAAAGNEEAILRVRNVMGVVYCELSQPSLALTEHLHCLEGVRAGTITDLNFSVNVYRNVANDYALQQRTADAVDTNSEALPLLEDLSDMEHQAMLYAGRAAASRRDHDAAHAKLYATRALSLYEASENRADAASICLSLAEAMIEEERFAEAREMLERASTLVAGTGNKAILTSLYKNYAALARNEGNHADAAEYAARGLQTARAYYEAARGRESEQDITLNDSIRTYSEALVTGAESHEALGERAAADELFGQAVDLLSQTNMDDVKHGVYLQFAKVLQEREDFEKAAGLFRMAAELRPQVKGRGQRRA